MTMMTKDKLLDALSEHGYTFVRPSQNVEPEEVLRELLKQNDPRLLEAFPVVVANAMKKGKLDWEKSSWNPKNELSKKERDLLLNLFAVSYMLFKLYEPKSKLASRSWQMLSKFEDYDVALNHVKHFFMEDREDNHSPYLNKWFSPERFTNSFRNYVVHEKEEANDFGEKKRALELELLLSELFTAKQKTLLKKKLMGKRLQKTEQEYYSRVVKKRLRALANSELHQLAKMLV